MRRLIPFLLFLLFAAGALGAQLELPPPGSRVYTVQVGSFLKKEEALWVFEKVKDLPGARIVLRGGRYKVRVGFFSSYKKALEFCRSAHIPQRVDSYYVTLVRFYPKGIVELAGEPPKKEVKTVNATELRPSVKLVTFIPLNEKASNSKGSEAKPKTSETSKPPQVNGTARVETPEPSAPKSLPSGKTPEREGSFHLPARKLLYGFGALLALGVAVLFLRRRSLRSSTPQAVVAKLLADGKFEELIEFALPYLEENPKDTFVKKALAESYEKLGRFLEAAAVYEEISKDLEEKGLNILAEGFRKRAEELYAAEFKKGG